MKQRFSVHFLYVIFLLFMNLGCSKNNNEIQDPLEASQNLTLKAENLKIDENGFSLISGEIKTAHGNIIFKFYPKHAPATVNRVIQLIESGFYNGLTFSRVVKNYLIQTGDPTGTGQGGSGKKIKAEVSNLQHIKGTMAMARFEDKLDSADSQFYITLTNASHLDGLYTIFAQVVDGFQVLEKINKDDKVISVTILPTSKTLQKL